LCRGWRYLGLHMQPQKDQTYAVLTEGRRVIAQVETGEAKGVIAKDALQESQLLAPMPGVVVTIHVQEGDVVEKGQVLVTQESMKMQMELRAPVTGRVSKIAAQAHTPVEKGALLVDIQPADIQSKQSG
ncbi:MAG: biotin/lipoyl-binding protein, partial [Anaerolineaceae bacterium]|nr:biotin/lipoyl-binding protein [Anaerolineaceae bacterium]